jgi:TrmH family RNA methyltransferase
VIVPLGGQSERLTRIASLKTLKGRRRHDRYALEGPTLLHEAVGAGVALEELYATQTALGEHPALARLAEHLPTYVVSDRSFARLSDVESPTGILAVASARLEPLGELFAGGTRVLVLAGLSDPGNAGTLLRSADAFGAGGAVFGEGGVDPFSPKVVRGAMGAFFRLRIASAGPQAFAAASKAAGYQVVGLRAGAPPLASHRWAARTALVVGHERHGLGEWEAACSSFAGISIAATSDSLNAGVAGSIALYEAARSNEKSDF